MPPSKNRYFKNILSARGFAAEYDRYIAESLTLSRALENTFVSKETE